MRTGGVTPDASTSQALCRPITLAASTWARRGNSHKLDKAQSRSYYFILFSPTTYDYVCPYVLRCPKSSDIARKRSVDRNPPNGKKRSRRSRGDGASEPKLVNPHDRVKEFPNQSLTVSNKKLFCLACREELSLKRSVLHGHLQSSKHKSGEERLAGKKKRDTDIAEALQASDASEHLKRGTLPQAQRVYSVKVVQTFLRAGDL